MTPPEFSRPSSGRGCCRACEGSKTNGFTLVELLVVMAVLGVLALTLLPVLAKERSKPQGTQCFGNFRQLSNAWLMYADDNRGNFPGNKWQDEEKWEPPQTPPENWISGWTDPSGRDGSSGSGLPNPDSDNTNIMLLVNPKYASLANYTKSPALYVCPSSITMVDSVLSGPQTYPICRTVSMNSWVGYVSSPPNNPTLYKEFTKTTDVHAGIDPAHLFVFMEERSESIDDGSFGVDEGVSDMFNWPANNHNGAATISFADGHVEVHLWSGTGPNVVDSNGNHVNTTMPQVPFVSQKWTTAPIAGFYATDLTWLQSHATCQIAY